MNKADGIAKQLKIVKIGDEAGVVLSPKLLVRLQLAIGDSLSLTEMPGGISLSTEDADFAHAMESAETIMEEDREILRVLAK